MHAARESCQQKQQHRCTKMPKWELHPFGSTKTHGNKFGSIIRNCTWQGRTGQCLHMKTSGNKLEETVRRGSLWSLCFYPFCVFSFLPGCLKGSIWSQSKLCLNKTWGKIKEKHGVMVTDQESGRLGTFRSKLFWYITVNTHSYPRDYRGITLEMHSLVLQTGF